MSTVVRLPQRFEVAESDTWDLTLLFKTDADWEKAFEKFESLIRWLPAVQRQAW